MNYCGSGMQTSYRPEQMRVYYYLLQKFPNEDIRLEYIVKNLKAFDGINLSFTYKRPILDIALFLPNLKVAIRLMGEIHRKSKRYKIRDEDQSLVLGWNGWKVIDMWYDMMPLLWSGKEGYESEIEDILRENKIIKQTWQTK